MKKIIVLVGPTGVGKTSLSIELAKRFNGEVISGDSMQVYKEMTIGTAKVTPEEADGVVHHLIDAFSYTDDYNVKIFQKMGREAIEDMSERGCLPIVCGGTGLYIKSLYYDYEFNDEEKDEEFADFLNSRSSDECYRMLKTVDPKACETIHANNQKRVKRALMRAHLGNYKSEMEEKQKHEPVYDALVIGLTTDRETVYERINQRVDIMIENGLEEEIKGLLGPEDVWRLQSMAGIGYKEWEAYFQGNSTVEETAELIKKNSRNFAKRQYTWFNNQMKVNWFDIKEDNWKENCMKMIENWLEDKTNE